jgi:UDP-N-acetylenolpyruvoylglucosamine reductase
MERLYGIPGTVAGALVGNAGAYGQQIGESVLEVSIWSNHQVQVLPAGDLDLRYRNSLFQRQRDWFILKCRLRLRKSSEPLQEISDEILTKRLVKYPQGLKCPGSFFKNLNLDEVPKTALEKIPEDFIMFGKIPAGKLLEAVGANGVRRGNAQFADYHGNLIVNLGQATSQDILTLADEYAGRVWEHFRIRLEPEILILDEPTAGKGPEESRRMVAFLTQLKGTITVVLVEHDMDAVFALADRITVLVYGGVMAVGTPAEIRTNADVRRAYLGEGEDG